MTKRRLARISPWQAAKVLSLLYFVTGVIAALLMAALSAFVPPAPGQEAPGIGFIIMLPVIYGLAGLVLVPIACWMYNTVARFTGGIEISVEDAGDR